MRQIIELIPPISSGCSLVFFAGIKTETQLTVNGCQYPLGGVRITLPTAENGAFSGVGSGAYTSHGACVGSGSPSLFCNPMPAIPVGPGNELIVDLTPQCTSGTPVQIRYTIDVSQTKTRETKPVTFHCP